jgi:hypothetical protein
MANQNWPFSKPLEFLHKVKYGGAVGKKTAITVVVLIVLAIALLVCWRLEMKTGVYLSLGLLIVVFIYALNSIDKTLEKHPQLAVLDGSEFVQYRKMELEMAAKGILELPKSPLIPDSRHPPRQLPPAEEENE